MTSDARTFVRLHDGLPDHPKVLQAGPEAAWLYVCGLCYCSRYLTDGLIPKGMAGRLSEVKAPARAIGRLLDVGLWTEEPEHYRVHDYLDHQRSAAEVEAIRAKRREAGARGGKARANAQANAKAGLPPPEEANGYPENREQRTEEEPPVGPPVGPPSDRPLALVPVNAVDAEASDKPSTRRKRQLPDGWEPNDRHRALAGELRLNLGAELAQFRDHHRAAGKTMLDWDAAFRTWLRNAVKFQRGGIAPPTPREAAPKCRACSTNHHRACLAARQGEACCCVTDRRTG